MNYDFFIKATNDSLIIADRGQSFDQEGIISICSTNLSSKDSENILNDFDCNDDELLVNEINAGIYLFENKYLFDYIPQLNNKNAQGEYYLPDAINLMIANKHLVAIYQTKNTWEIKGINSKEQLIELNQYLNKIEKK